MQPYFLPYIGYFQLINSVDKFVVYDNVQYTKRGWINRNKYLLNDKSKYFTIPVEKFSQQQKIQKIKISKIYKKEKILRQFYNAYQKAPFFNETYKLLTKIVMFSNFLLYLILI